MTYAASTDVSSDRSRAEIEKTLRRYGADQFMYGWTPGHAVVGFIAFGRRVQFVLPMPDPNDKRFQYTPTRRQRRSPEQSEREFEQAVRQRWRALALVIKAKLEAVQAGITTFDDEFLAHLMLPDGRTVAETVLPGVIQAYETNSVPALLPSYTKEIEA